MGTENDIESFIQLQKQKLAQEREGLHQSNFDQENRQQKIFDSQINGATERKPQVSSTKTDVNGNQQHSSNPLPFGDYDQKRKQLNDERKREYNLRNQNRPVKHNNQQADAGDEGGMFSKLGQYEAKRKVLDVERNNEYNRKLTEAEARRTGRQPTFAESGLPGLRDHPSANQVKVKQRNAEYNQFLQQQEQKRNNRFADKKGLPVESFPQHPSRNQQPLNPTSQTQASPRRGGGPSYDELLDEKRRQEQSYRRRNDPEALPNDTRRTYPQPRALQSNDRRFEDLDRQYEQRKVKFANERSIGEDGGSGDVYDWLKQIKQKFGVGDLPTPIQEHSKQGRSRSFYQDPQPKPYDPYERSRSVPPKEEQTGLAIGNNETASAARRRKEQYRQELQQQMTGTSRGRHSDPGGYPRENNFSSLPYQDNFQLPKPTFSDQSASILDDRRPLASILNERRDLVDTSPRGNAIRSGLGPGLLERGFTGLYEPSVLSQARQPPPPQNQGYIPPSYTPAPQLYQTPADPAYNFYGSHEPLASFTAPPLGPPRHPNIGQQQQAPQPKNNSFKTAAVAVGAFPSERTDKDRLKKDNQQSYQNELKKQMEEKQRIAAAKKAEQDAYDRKLNEEIANYNPFGRGGAGAPVKDTSGNVVADLRTMNLSNTGQTPRLEVQKAPSQPAVGTTPRANSTYPDISISLPNAAAADGHARGGNGIFGDPKTEVQKTAADRYKEELKLQIEEKKRVAELEKQKLKAEEEREMKRLEEDRLKIQKEYEAEQAMLKAKEDETRRKNEELKQAAEEKRRQAEQEQKQAEEKRRQKEQERKQKEREEEQQRQKEVPIKVENRVESPPIPTLRSKTQPPGSLDFREPSPPIPTQRSKTQHDVDSLNNSKPLLREPEKPAANPPRHVQPTPSPHPQGRAESRAQSAEVLNQLAHMRQQLQQERQRVENALNKEKSNANPRRLGRKLDVDVYDPRTRITGDDSSDIDVFEIARTKKPVSASRRNKGESDEPPPQQPLNKPTTAASLLQSDSAFIDDRGMRAAFPDDFDTLATNQDARRRRRERMKPTEDADADFMRLMRGYIGTPESPDGMLKHYQQQNKVKEPRKVMFEDEAEPTGYQLQNKDTESVHSIDPDRITRKNQDRLKKLKAIAGDDISLDDPDDIIDRFMTKQNHNRPPSGQTLTDDSWIRSNR